GSASEELYTLAADCDIFLDSPEPDRNLEIVQGLRLCLFYEKRMNPDDISNLYARVYGEASRQDPLTYLKTVVHQLGDYLITFSAPFDEAGTEQLTPQCS